MQKVSIQLENCYGISYFSHEFDFSKSLFQNSIYQASLRDMSLIMAA